jgi:hypothetical protein
MATVRMMPGNEVQFRLDDDGQLYVKFYDMGYMPIALFDCSLQVHRDMIDVSTFENQETMAGPTSIELDCRFHSTGAPVQFEDDEGVEVVCTDDAREVQL